MKKICRDCTILGLKTVREAQGDGEVPLKFLFVSGAATISDQKNIPTGAFVPEYSLMRVNMSTVPFSLITFFCHFLPDANGF